MEINNSEEKRYLKAQKRVKEIKGFYVHLTVMLFILPLMTFINLKFTPQYHWFWWVILGNVIGLLFHWLGVFGNNFFGFTKEWEEKKIKEYMNQ